MEKTAEVGKVAEKEKEEEMICIPEERCGEDVLDTYATIECNAFMLM